ncbi:protein of unknown function DUF58 [Oscillochloris trichoides DG-6]|uniref:DUF58 domain-containing protein n=1 Tax=Oscillochloris trichoides DG-6 TaxID=765420 RepID=E1IEB0_9CHLR|nr:DUF58 domain-containing protein [Oscillochloris trichoides]EFO80436.1 protein of unknown function DUF58 [Oscillochloris trichoides DG-6]
MLRPLIVLVLSGASFLAAQGTGLRLFFHLSYVLLGLLLLSFVWAWVNLRGLRVERETLTLRAHVGEFARERISIDNRWWLPKLWIELLDQSELPHHGVGFVTSLGIGQQGRWIARTLCTHRGRYRLGPATLVSGDPFGIVRLARTVPTTNEILVYPQMVDLPGFQLPSAELPGGQATRARTFHVTPNVATVRDYVPGDSFNRIHWRTTARMGQLMVKEFELDPSADVYIVLDMQERTVVRDRRERRRVTDRDQAPWWRRQPNMQRGQTMVAASSEEYAVMAAASLARTLLAQNRVVGMIAWGQHREIIPAERESRQLFKILESLAVLRAHGTQSLAEVLIAESQRFGRNSTLLIITSALDERWIEALQQHLMRGVRAAVIFVDPQSFGGVQAVEPLLRRVTELNIPLYRLRQGESLALALSMPLQREIMR